MNHLILVNGYPSAEDIYRNGFVHRRVKAYIEMSRNTYTVFVFDKKVYKQESYTYDGVHVLKGNAEVFKQYLMSNTPDNILIHFLNVSMIKALESSNYDKKIFIWIHGVEGLSWHRRLFDINSLSFAKYVINNIKQKKELSRFIEKYHQQLHFIFVSNWMKEIFKQDIFTIEENYSIIPNIIDSNLFEYKEKQSELRKKVLLLRPFTTRKYANDIAVKAIEILSEKEAFKEFEFTIIGRGKHFNKLTSKIKHFENVKLINDFISQSEIPNYHANHGVFLCPTRQDSQGVSMCEAMSSGLVVVTSNSTAIPEFVTHQQSGFLTEDAQDIADTLLYLLKNPSVYNKVSIESSASINDQCGVKNTIIKEMQLIENVK